MGAHLLPHKWPFFVNPALPPKGGDGGVNTVPSDLIFQHDFLMFWNFIQKVLVLLEGRYRYLPGEGGSSCPFRKRWLPF